MKKVSRFLFIFVLLILLSGCKHKEVVTNCNLKNNQEKSGYQIKSNYKIHSTDDIVTKIEIEEAVISKNNTILAYFEKDLNNRYNEYNKKYNGYEYKVTKKEGKVVANVTVDYKKVSMDKFVKDNSNIKDYVNKDKNLSLEGAKELYKSMGATCDKK